jgi:membrane protein DedA with SNARE-associated domain
LACLTGSLIAYYVGAAGGRPFLLRYGRYILVSKREIDLADRWFLRYGDKIIFISRLLPIIRTFISLPAGITRMELKTFTLYTFLGSLPFCFLLTYIGMQLGPHWDSIIEFFDSLDLAIILGLLLFLAISIYRSKIGRGAEG